MREAKPKQNPLYFTSSFLQTLPSSFSHAEKKFLQLQQEPSGLFLIPFHYFFYVFSISSNASSIYRMNLLLESRFVCFFIYFLLFFFVEIIDFLAIQLFYSRWISELSATYYRHGYRIRP